MRIAQLATLLDAAIPARRPVLIVGEPGVGKSAVIRQSAERAGADFIQSHPGIEDPTDPKGLPMLVDGRAEFLPFGQLRRARAAERLTVWNLEDLGQATPAVQASYMPLLDAARNGELPNIVFVASTNDRKHRAGVSGLLEPVKSRFASIVTLEAHIDDWSQWAIRSGKIPPEEIGFLRFRSDLLSAFNPTADLTNSPNPRTWEAAADILALQLPRDVQAETLCGTVGQGAATELLAFLSMFAQLPSIDGILVDPDHAAIPNEPSARYAVVTALAARAGEAAFPRVARYAERLHAAGAGDFAALLVRDSVRRHPAVVQTPAFVQLASGGLSNLLTGN